jgi:predicted ATP-grasp superfamily ATP-dependent carboligase
MPSRRPAPSAKSNATGVATARPWLLIGLSVRALAQAAARGGYAVCAVDAFADRDTTSACAGRVTRLGVDAHYRIEPAALVAAAGLAQRRFAPDGFAGIVAGSGFDGRPELVAELAGLGPFSGCDAPVMRALREPRRWFALLDALDVPHPPVRFEPHADKHCWLVKSASGSGGWHVQPWHASMKLGADGYFQRRRRGRPASALFVADGRNVRVIGWQWQLLAASRELPWRYGGVITANDLPAAVRERIATALAAIVGRVPLRGLAGLDFLVDGDKVEVLELNPRPTASISLYPQHDLFGMHLAACAGAMPTAALPAGATLRGEAVLYAPQRMRVDGDFPWPEGCADIPAATADFALGEPVCTVGAEAESIRSLRLRLAHRQRSLLNTMMENQTHEYRNAERQCIGDAARTSAAG